MDLVEAYDAAIDTYRSLVKTINEAMGRSLENVGVNPYVEAAQIAMITRLRQKKDVFDYRDIAALLLYDYEPEVAFLVASALAPIPHAYENILEAMELVDEGYITTYSAVYDLYPRVEQFFRNGKEREERAKKFLTLSTILSPNGFDDLLRSRSRFQAIRRQEIKDAVAAEIASINPHLAAYITQ